jgi:hypothetical protein
MLPTLDEFIQEGLNGDRPRNSYVTYPRFEELYVRLVPFRVINRTKVGPVLDIGRVTARKKGKGAFKALVKYIQTTYPMLHILIESVQTKKFADGLERMGFSNVTPEFLLCPNFYLPPESHEQDQDLQQATAQGGLRQPAHDQL